MVKKEKEIKVHLDTALGLGGTKIEGLILHFSSEQVARKYSDTITDHPKLQSTNDRKVNLHFPSTVRSVDFSQNYGGFVFHFDTEARATAWQDAICIGVSNFPRQVCVKQYWEEGELTKVLDAASQRQVFKKPAAPKVPNRPPPARQPSQSPPRRPPMSRSIESMKEMKEMMSGRRKKKDQKN